MPVPTELLADEIKDLTVSMGALRTEFAGFRGVVETKLSLIEAIGRWIVRFSAGVLVAIVVGAASIAWRASSLESEVRQQGVRLGRVEQQLGRLDKIEQQLGQIIQRLDQAAMPKSKP